MNLHDIMVKHGHTMFRWRSYLPLLIAGPLLIALKEAAHMEAILGETAEDIWVLFCFILSLFGLGIRWVTVGFIPGSTSGRNTKEQRADVLNTSGMYAIVRNPLYLGNFITIIGVLLSLKVWWLVVIGSFGFFIYMERIVLAEEKYLSEKFGRIYDDWRAMTPVIIPDFKRWKAPAMSFSWKTVLKREYPGLLGVGTAFFLTEVIVDLAIEKEPFAQWLREDYPWPVTYGLIVIFCLTLRTLKKNTTVLKVEGR